MNSDAIPKIGLTEAAKLLGVTWTTAHQWARSGKLKTVMVGGRYRTTEAWIQQFVRPVVIPTTNEPNEKKDRNDRKNYDDAVASLCARIPSLRKVFGSRLQSGR